LEIRSRLNFNLDPELCQQIKGVPSSTNALSNSESVSNDILSKDTARGITNKVRSRPLPKAKKREIEGSFVSMKALSSGFLGNLQLRKSCVVNHHIYNLTKDEDS